MPTVQKTGIIMAGGVVGDVIHTIASTINSNTQSNSSSNKTSDISKVHLMVLWIFEIIVAL